MTGAVTSSPLRAVLDAFSGRASTLDDVATMTGLPRDVVDAAVEHLVRVGRLSASTLTMGCPSGGCGSCASGTSGAPGCGAAAPGPARSGPVRPGPGGLVAAPPSPPPPCMKVPFCAQGRMNRTCMDDASDSLPRP